MALALRTNSIHVAKPGQLLQWRGDYPKREYKEQQQRRKGRKEGSGGRMSIFFVDISHGNGVIICKHCPWKLSGEKFASFVKQCFPLAFEKCGIHVDDAIFLQDGDPRQNLNVAWDSCENLNCKIFKIPPHSPDLKPIENLFHLVREQLKKDAMEKSIVQGYNEFCKRVAQKLDNFPVETILKKVAESNTNL